MMSSHYREIARDRLQGNWGLSILVGVIATLLGAISAGGFSINLEDYEFLMKYDWAVVILTALASYGTIASIVAFILGGVVELGYCTYLMKQYDRGDFKLQDLFSHISTNFGGGFCLRLLSNIYIALWSLLFVIPGIVKTYSYAMAPYLMAEHPEWGAKECITRSRELMNGHKWELFCLDFSFIGWILLSIFTLGIGGIVLLPYQRAARTAFYRNLSPNVI